MRLLASIFCGSIVSIVAFSALWSGFVVRHHSYGGDSRLSQFGGTLVFFGAYLLPILIAVLLIFMPSAELIFIQKKKRRVSAWWRWILWSIVSLSVLAGIAISEIPEQSFAAVVSGLVAGISGAVIYERIAASLPRNENGG